MTLKVPDTVKSSDTRIAMFCTGGIRCEKATAYLREKGFEKVYHLEGGILKYLEVIPEEVIAKDYGCGDPSKYLHPGETVLDLGSGTGKICFIASQVVGTGGKVIGVDMTDDMLEVARRNAPLVAERTGCSNVSFHKGRIEDLALDLEKFEEQLQANPVTGANDFLAAEDRAAEMRSAQPMIADNTIDVVVSNCVLNLVDNRLKEKLFREIYRVLKIGGRVRKTRNTFFCNIFKIQANLLISADMTYC